MIFQDVVMDKIRQSLLQLVPLLLLSKSAPVAEDAWKDVAEK